MSTAETLEYRLTAVRRRVRRSLIAWGVSWLLAVSLGALLIVCLGDWLVHFDDPVLRLLLALGIAGGSVYVVLRRLVAPLTTPLSDTDLALRIEGRFPGFEDSLASSVQFANSSANPRIGSPALQRAVVRSTLDRLAGLEAEDVVDTREVKKITSFALAAVAVSLLLAGLFRGPASIALQRLIFPFSAPAWPRETNLRLLNAELEPITLDPAKPVQVARGDALKLFVENGTGHLPPRVSLETRQAHQPPVSEPMQSRTMTDSGSERREIAIGQIVALKDSIEFRATGGDDDQMPWYRLEAVPPPVVERLELTVTPPAYTRRAAERQPEGAGHVQGLVGTRVEIAARTSKPVAKGLLRVKDKSRLPVEIEQGGREIRASFVISDAGVHSWWLELKDAQGFEDAEPPRYEVRGIQDFEPEIYIERPAGDMQITPDAFVPLRTVAKDDLGINEVKLVFKAESSAGALEGGSSLYSAGDEPSLSQKVDYRWDIGELHPEAGTRIVFHTEATDDFDLTGAFPEGKVPPPHVGRSVTRTLTVVSREEKAHEIAQRHEGLLNDLDRALQLQQQAHGQIEDLLTQLENAGELRPEDLDALKRTELGQREVGTQLTNPSRGLEKRARELFEELESNRIDDPDGERRIRRLADEVSRLGHEHLEPIEQRLTQARKLLQSAPKERPVDTLGQVSQDQEAVIESLSEMLQDLSQWRGEHDASRELSELTKQQGELQRRTAELGRRTLTKSSDSLSPQENADLAKLADRQKKLAEQLEQFESRMQGNAEGLSDENPAAAAALRDTAEQSRDEAIAGRMRDAAGEIGENRMGQAGRSQQDVLRKLKELEDTLRQNQETDGEMLIKKLKQAESALEKLCECQTDLLRSGGQSAGNTNPEQRQNELEQLRKKQRELEQETARLARQLARLEARRAQTSAARAASEMRQAQEALGQGDQAQAAEEQQEALDDLEQARRELARERRIAEEELAREQLARVVDEIAAMIGRQQSAIDETGRLESLRAAAGKWTRSQLVALRDLAGAQRSLAEDTSRIAENLSAAEVFARALKGAARRMERAAEKLDGRDAGSETQREQESARQRLVELVAALKPEPPGPEPQAQPGGGGDQNEGAAPSEGVPAIAQLKMLIALQKDLAARTAELEKQRGADNRLPAPARDELEALAREQGELADLARNLSELSSSQQDSAKPVQIEPKAEEAPEELPEEPQ